MSARIESAFGMLLSVLLIQLVIVEGHVLNGSGHALPSPIMEYSALQNSVIVYGNPEKDCFCRTDQGWVNCVGKGCLNVPRNVTVPNGKLRVTSTEIDSLTDVDFIGYERLVELQLDGNEISKIAIGTFSHLSQLVNLSISFNRLKQLEPGTFNGLTSLKTLRLTKNAFTKLNDVIPSLAGLTLTRLILNENTFGRIDTDDFASMANSSLETLELENCDLKYINSEAFTPLKNLTKLQLSENTMPDDNLVHLFSVMKDSQLRALDLSRIRFAGGGLRKLLEVLSRSNVTELHLSYNILTRLSSRFFPAMPNIQHLDLSRCGIINIDNGTFAGLPNLKILNLAKNTLSVIPPAILLPQLERLNFNDNTGRHSTGGELELCDGAFKLMSNLTFLDLSYNRIGVILSGVFLGLNRLKELVLKNCSLYRIEEGCFKPLTSLTVLHLEGNSFDSQNFSRVTFEGLYSLQYLYMDNCKINSFAEDGIFSQSSQLLYISLRNNQLKSLDPNPFIGTPNLVTIDLTDNLIREWNERLFATSPQLEYLILSNNQISTSTTAMEEDFTALREVDLFGNPLDCDCQLLPYKKYVLDHEDTNDSYLILKADLCFYPDDWRFKPVINFLLNLPDDCVESAESTVVVHSFSYIALYISLSLLLLLFVIAIILYKCRWYIRYCLFRWRINRLRLKTVLSEDRSDYRYDAFISYSNEDHVFVVRLVSMLENQSPHFKLCVFERDFTAGTVLNECILQSIACSRKVVLLISDNFLRSQWCLWEMHLAQHSLLEEKREGLILIKMGNLKMSNVTPTLRYLMKTRIYLEWDPDPLKQRLFWTRLRNALSCPSKHFPVTRNV